MSEIFRRMNDYIGFSLRKSGNSTKMPRPIARSGKRNPLSIEYAGEHRHSPTRGSAGKSPRKSKKSKPEDEYSVIFELGDIYAYTTGLWYKARIIAVDESGHPTDKDKMVPCYQIHYPSFSSKYDEWVMSDSLMAFNDENSFIAARENDEQRAKTESKKGERGSRTKGAPKAVTTEDIGRKSKRERPRSQSPNTPSPVRNPLKLTDQAERRQTRSQPTAGASGPTTPPMEKKTPATVKSSPSKPLDTRSHHQSTKTRSDRGKFISVTSKTKPSSPLQRKGGSPPSSPPPAKRTRLSAQAVSPTAKLPVLKCPSAIPKIMKPLSSTVASPPPPRVTLQVKPTPSMTVASQRPGPSSATAAVPAVKKPSPTASIANFPKKSTIPMAAVRAVPRPEVKPEAPERKRPSATDIVVKCAKSDMGESATAKPSLKLARPSDWKLVKPAPVIAVPELKPQPFLKTFSQFALRGVSLLSLPSLKSLGVHRQATIAFAFPNFADLLASATQSTRILVRFCQYPNTSYPASECHPKDLRLTLNGEHYLVETVSPAPTTLVNGDRFVAAIEFDTGMLKPNNAVSIEWTDTSIVGEAVQDFLVFIERAERKSVQTAMTELRAREVQMIGSIGKLYDLLTVRAAQGKPSQVTFPLLCPLSKRRIIDPVRGKGCQHVECFDGESYVMANILKRPQWICPLCMSSVLLDDLIVDEYVRLLLEFTEHDRVLVLSQANSRDLVVREITETTAPAIAALGDPQQPGLPKPSPLLDQIPVEVLVGL